MIALRDKPWRRFGAVLAGLAIYLQLALAGLAGAPLAASSTAADRLAEHALCLAGAAGERQQLPGDPAPVAPAHDHTLFCCLWHSPAGPAPDAARLPVPVAYAVAALREAAGSSLVPGPRRGPGNARAPPTPV
jgi:hypothetical protein